MRHRVCLAGLVFALTGLVFACVSRGQALPLTFTFDASSEKWSNQSPIDDHSVSEWLKEGGRTKGGIHMRGTGGDANQMRVWRKVVQNPPTRKRIEYSAWVKGKGVENVVSVVAQAHWTDEGFSSFDAASSQAAFPLKGDFDWTRVHAVLDVPRETRNVQLLLLLAGNGEVWFDDVEVREVGEAQLIEPGLFVARGKSKITTRTDADAIRLVPLPLAYEAQAPLGYTLTVEPAERLRAATVYEDKVGNWVMRLTIAHPESGKANDPVVVEWSSVVLVGEQSFAGVPKTAAYPAEWPEEAKAWLASTLCVQAGDERIKKVAAEIRGESTDVMEVIRATLERTASIYEGQTGRCPTLDAVNALDKQGSCTSCANLVAALLRASGIPARILAGYPAWAGPLQTHYIVEAYVPGHGWYPIESSKLLAPWPRHQQIQVSIVPPEYEDKSGLRPQIAGGVPYLSLDERATDSEAFFTHGIINEKRPQCDHEAVVLRNLELGGAEGAALVADAAARWKAWLASKPEGSATAPLKFGLGAEGLEKASVAEVRERMRN